MENKSLLIYVVNVTISPVDTFSNNKQKNPSLGGGNESTAYATKIVFVSFKINVAGSWMCFFLALHELCILRTCVGSECLSIVGSYTLHMGGGWKIMVVFITRYTRRGRGGLWRFVTRYTRRGEWGSINFCYTLHTHTPPGVFFCVMHTNLRKCITSN